MMRPQLEFSCPESWDKMTPAAGGRFCRSCEKVVVDFSEMSDGEILNALSKSDPRLCGRFRNDQLEKPFGDYRDRVLALYRKANEISPKKYYVRAAMLCLAVSLMFLTGCTKKSRPIHSQGTRVFYFNDTKTSQQQLPANW